MSAIDLPDLAARVRAATDFETNLVVLAGAGTGKTSLLVERALNAVGAGVATMEQIAAITFTEKAAGEMRERLAAGLERLRAAGRGEIDIDPADEAGRAFEHLSGKLAVSPARITERALAAMEALDRSTVTTIHGFCSELLRAHPFESGVEPDFAVDNGEHAEEQRRRMWDAFLAAELGPAAGRAELWRELLDDPGLSTVGEIALALADFHIPRQLLDPPFTGPDVRDLFTDEIARLRTSIAETLERQVGLAATPLRFLEGMQSVLAALSERRLDGLREALRADEDLASRLTKNPPTVGKKVQGVSIDDTKALIRDTRRLARALGRVDDTLIARVLEAVAPFAIRFREGFLRQGFLSFDALLGLTRDLLRDHPDARAALKRRFRMLLVDEFQDTDPVQYEIVLLLAEAPDESTSDAFTARLEPGRLFVVGDAKQSVYRFRGADYTAYRRATERIVEAGGVQLDLIGNFRSTPGIIDPVNRLFDRGSVCWEPSDYQPDYTAIQAARPAGDGPAVELWTIASGKNVRAHERREAEGRALASEIERRVEAGECAYRQITILFRAFTNISHYLRPLRERQIPFVIDGGRDFLVRPEVEQLMATLKTLA
jgi:ATP-dependent helicase/nuclease subunit A